MEGFLAKLGGWLIGLIPAALGSAFSLFIDESKTKNLSKFIIFCTFGFGLIIGYIFGGAIADYFKISHDTFFAFSLKFTVGAMGIGTLVEVKGQIALAITAIRKRYLGE
jgi:hypothetical protein